MYLVFVYMNECLCVCVTFFVLHRVSDFAILPNLVCKVNEYVQVYVCGVCYITTAVCTYSVFVYR